MKRKAGLLLLLTLSMGVQAGAQSLYPSVYEIIYSLFALDPNEGLTTFLSTLIPMGGSAEAMGTAFTAVSSDASFLELNPAGSEIGRASCRERV